MLSLNAFPADRASAQCTLQFRVTRQHSSLSGAAHSCSAMDIYVVFTQLSSQDMRSRALSAFATLLSTVCVTSGVPAITGRSCSSILCQAMRTEVSFPLHSQVTASLHHPRTGAFTSSTRTLLSSKAAGHSQGWVELKQEHRVRLDFGHQAIPQQVGRYSGDWQEDGTQNINGRGKDDEKHRNSFCEIRRN